MSKKRKLEDITATTTATDKNGRMYNAAGFPENLPQEIKDNNEPIFISAFLGDNPDQALATAVYSKVVGTSSENNEIKLDVDGYGLINASEAVRFRN